MLLLRAGSARPGLLHRIGAASMRASSSHSEASIAVIGGGLAGLSAAQQLAKSGHSVTVYDMGTRGPGGRSSTRQVEHGDTALQFDHGSQFLRVSDPEVQQRAIEWEEQGFLAPWNARLGSLDAATGGFTDRKQSHAAASSSRQGFCGVLGSGQILVGTPGMSAICRQLAQQPGIEGQWGAKVKRAVQQQGGLWKVTAEVGRDKQELTALHSVVVLADQMNVRSESPGYVELQCSSASPVAQKLDSIQRSPRFSLMLALPQNAIRAPFDGASIANSSTIEWVARDSSKPGRERDDGVECWVAVTTEAFSEHLLSGKPLTRDGRYLPQSQGDLSDAAGIIWAELQEVLRPFLSEEPEPVYLHAQRWGSAFKATVLEEPCLWDPSLRLAACGDFCRQSDAEGAILSGLAAVDAVMELAQRR